MENARKTAVAIGLTAALTLGSFGVVNTAYADVNTEASDVTETQQVAAKASYKTWPVTIMKINEDRSEFDSINTSIDVENPTFVIDQGFVGGKIQDVLTAEVGPSHRDDKSDSGIKYWFLWDSPVYTSDGKTSNELVSSADNNDFGLVNGEELYCVPVVYSINLYNTDLAQTTYLYYPGETPKLPDLTREGYVFTGWYTDSECTQAYETQALAKQATYGTQTIELSLYAGWEAKQATTYTVKFDDCLDSTSDPTITVEEGGTIAQADIPADPTCEGYKFLGWCTYDRETKTYTPWDFENSAVTGDLILYAKWEQIDPATDEEDATETPVDSVNSDNNTTNSNTDKNAAADSSDGEESALPQTGDSALPFAAGTAALISAAGIATALGMRKRSLFK